jgi:hypothetical protein
MTGQVWRSSNPIRLQQNVTLTQRILQLLESRGYLLLLFTSLLGSLSLPVRSQQFPALPNTPSFNKKLFIAELSTYTAMNVLDGITTTHMIHEGYVEGSFPVGSSYLLGRWPSVVRYAVAMGLLPMALSPPPASVFSLA